LASVIGRRIEAETLDTLFIVLEHWHLSMEIRHSAVFALDGQVATDLFGSRREDWQLQLGHSESSVLLAPARFATFSPAGSFHFPVSHENSRLDHFGDFCRKPLP
jgi:hypothetical protein